MDYDIQLNDVIQLMIKQNEVETTTDEKTNAEENVDRKIDENELVNVKSDYYKVGDPIDLQENIYGAWFEYIIDEIKAKKKDIGDDGKVDEQNIQFFATWEM